MRAGTTLPANTTSVTGGSISRRKRAVFAGLSLTLSASISFAVLETVSRTLEKRGAEERQKPASRLNILQANPAGTGSFRLVPNLDVAATVKGRTVRLRTNSHGMRWREVALAKPSGRKRIAFLGDSFTFGCWADSIEESFVGIFDSSVNNARFEVLNFGIGGYGLDDMDLLLREQVIRFSPDYVFVVVFTGNDFRDTYLGVHKYDLVDGTVELNPDNLRRKSLDPAVEREPFSVRPAADACPLRRALKRLATFRLLLPIVGLDNLWLDFKVSNAFTSFSYWSQHPFPEVARRAKDELLLTLGRMNAFAAEHDCQLAVVALPSREQVYARFESGPDYDIALPQAYIQIYARENGIPYLDLLPRLRAHVIETNDDLFVKDDIHLDNRGHRVTGRCLAEWFTSVVRKPRAGPPH